MKPGTLRTAILSFVLFGLLWLPSQARAQVFVLVADTGVCGSGSGLNALAVVGELQKRYGIKGNTLIIGGLHGGADGTVSDDAYDSPFFLRIQQALGQLQGGAKSAPLMVSAATIDKSFTENLDHYDVILLAWCNSDAWYEKTGKGLARSSHTEVTKVSFSTRH
jgi:hypothetical protein